MLVVVATDSNPIPIQHAEPLFTASTLDDGAFFALRDSGPVRAWRAFGDDIAEMFFYRELVIHATADGHVGTRAVRCLMSESHRPWHLERGGWPERHSLLIEWHQLRRSLQRPQPQPQVSARCASGVS